jgi:hypothetical protein
MAPKTLKQSSRDSDEEPCPHATIALDVISRAGAAELQRSRKVEGRIQPIQDLGFGCSQTIQKLEGVRGGCAVYVRMEFCTWQQANKRCNRKSLSIEKEYC